MHNKFLEACKKGDLKVVNELIGSMYIDYLCYKQMTGLLYASENGHTDIVENLIAYGANIEHHDSSGWTALHWASRFGHTETVEKLIAHEANIEHQDSSGMTGLHRASRFGHTETVEKLIAHGANIEHQDKNGWAALHWASYDGKIDVVEKLITRGVNVDHQNNDGDTALSISTRMGHLEIMVLLSPGLIDKQDENGNTLLSKACQDKNEKYVLFLHSKGADFNLKNNHGQSAFSILKRKRALSPELQAIKEHLILNKMIEYQEENALSL